VGLVESTHEEKNVKKVSGLIMLLLVGLLVALPVAAGTVKVPDEAFASGFAETKISVQEEVPAVIPRGEMPTAFAVAPSTAPLDTRSTALIVHGGYVPKVLSASAADEGGETGPRAWFP
jgi:hypothetical protein